MLAPLLLAALVVPRPQDAWTTSAGNVVVPQSRSVVLDRAAETLRITGVEVEVDVVGPVATTALEVGLANPGRRVEEAVLLVPVPDGAVVRGFDFEGGAAEPTARLLLAEEARAEYAAIVARSRDPALLEFAGWRTVRTSVFPVPAGGTQRVRLVYEHVVAADGDRLDYVLPRSEALVTAWTPWTVSLRLRGRGPIAAAYSPTHDVVARRVSPTELRLELGGEAAREPGPLRVSWLADGGGVSASLLAFPDGAGGGHLLLLAGLPAELPPEARQRRREVLLVLDRSGSMRGEKLDQARAAALQVIAGLEEGERFNVIDWSSGVASFAPAPVERTAEAERAARTYLEGLEAGGGTNLDLALRAALGQPHEEGTLPLVLLLTDGVPTEGRTCEAELRETAAGDRHGRRVFPFGVGHDVNVPLLDHLALSTRGAAEYVDPGDDVEQAVTRVFRRLHGPVLAEPRLSFHDAAGAETTRLVRDVVPGALPDLYEGDRLVVLGRYTAEEEVEVRLAGDWLGEERTFAYRFHLGRSSLEHAFVPRLWASRRIAELVDAIRLGGADSDAPQATLLADPRTREQMEEILRLSTEHGVLTEYTAFLALEGTDLSAGPALLEGLDERLLSRARLVRVGRAALSQSRNLSRQRVAQHTNRLNAFLDADLRRVRSGRVAQVADRAFFRQGPAWIDARLVHAPGAVAAARVVAHGSPDHVALVERLVGERRQAVFALGGDVVLELDGAAVWIRRPPPAPTGPEPEPSPGADAG